MNSDKIKTLISEWLESGPLPVMVKRDTSIEDLDRLSNILAIVGPRRAGKTWFMYQLIDSLLKKDLSKKDILFVDFEDYRLIGIQPTDIDHLLTGFYQLTNQYPRYLFFDEIQNLPHWNRVLRTLHNQNRYKIVISGSNSKLLTGEISTELRGRYEDLIILPFSFDEVLKLRNVTFDRTTFFTPKKGGLLNLFDGYLRQGGFPEVLKKINDVERNGLLQSYYRTLFYKDLLERHHIRAKTLIESMMNYCLDIMGDLFSISKFTKSIMATDLPVSKKTVSNYLHYLQEVFFIIVNDKFDFSPRKRLMNPKKVYLLDNGFSSISVNFSENRGKFLENVIAIQLFRQQQEMYYFKKDNECDFIIKRGTKPYMAIQSCWELNDMNRKRELLGIGEAMRILNIQHGFILTYDQEGVEKIEGRKVSIIPTYKWLLESV
jgi:predicted AAA+ superfamily ATPase